MDVKQEIKNFVVRNQTTGWMLALFLGGLLLQGIIFFLSVTFMNDGGKGAEVYDKIMNFLVIPGDGNVLWKPWTILSWPFFFHPSLADRFIHVLFGGLFFYTFGRIHQSILGDLRTRRLIILAIPLIALVTILVCVLAISTNNPITGGSSVSGLAPLMVLLVVSTIVMVPDQTIPLFLFGRVKILYVGLILVLFEVFYTVSLSIPTLIAVMVGGIFGLVYITLLKKGTDITELVWSYYQDRNPQPRMKVKHGKQSPKQGGGGSTSRKSKKGKIPQDLIDDILDKISDVGYENLSREEKELLFRASGQRDENAK